jgi:hypothetical protein
VITSLKYRSGHNNYFALTTFYLMGLSILSQYRSLFLGDIEESPMEVMKLPGTRWEKRREGIQRRR